MKSLTSCSDLRKIHSCSFTAYDSLITMITFNGIRFVGRFHCLKKVTIKSLTLFTTHCKMIIWFISLQNCLQCELNRKTNIQKPQKRFRCTNSKFDTRKILQKRLVMDFFPQAPSPPPPPLPHLSFLSLVLVQTLPINVSICAPIPPLPQH